MMLWIILLLALGLAMIFIPRILWKIEHIFSVKNGEPTELYLALMRIGGVVFVITAIICAIAG